MHSVDKARKEEERVFSVEVPAVVKKNARRSREQ